jgi:16S rRNA A1518/A1519 N6-dimethyltransferase RsmA/KsgA/DIM1 with predicted DNA glycosylase/AP lyase activity
MNTDHAQVCSSPEWADFLTTDVLPTALAGCDPGQDLLEIGPGYGAATARLVDLGGHLSAVEIDSALAASLRELFPGRRRRRRPG